MYLARVRDTPFLNFHLYMIHPTTDKGDIGVLKVMADLVGKGIPVFTPVSASSAFDLVILHSDTFKRVQVKYRAIENGRIAFTLNRKSTEAIYRNTEVDLLAIYCPDTDKCYYVSDPPYSIAIRFEASKNKQEKGVKYADDYLSL